MTNYENPRPIIDQTPLDPDFVMPPPPRMHPGSLGSEPLPSYYHDTDSATEQEAAHKSLKALRDELVYGHKDENLIKHSYGVARNIGDNYLSKQGEDGEEAFRLVDHVRYDTRPRQWVVDTSQDYALGKHSRINKTMYMNHNILLADAQASRRNHIEQAVQPKDPNDGLLLAYLSITAHEAGHSILGGVSSMLESKGMSRVKGGLTASHAFVAEHPEHGFANNEVTDTWIQEERFAEGYGRLVVGASMEALGYSKDETAAVLQAIRFQDVVTGGPGENQIDYIGQANNGAAIGLQIKTEKPHVDGQMTYEGELGYSLPLEVDEVVGQLAALSQLCQQEFYDKKEVTVKGETARDPKVTAHIEKLQAARAAFVEGQNKEQTAQVQKQRFQRVAKHVTRFAHRKRTT